MDHESFLEYLKKAGYDVIANFISKSSQNAIWLSLKRAEESCFDLGESKVGGIPHLPPHIPYPVSADKEFSLPFIAQLNLSEVSVFDTDRLLPKTGMLYFFCDYEKDEHKVIYYDGDIASVKPVKPELPYSYEPMHPCKIIFENHLVYHKDIFDGDWFYSYIEGDRDDEFEQFCLQGGLFDKQKVEEFQHKALKDESFLKAFFDTFYGHPIFSREARGLYETGGSTVFGYESSFQYDVVSSYIDECLLFQLDYDRDTHGEMFGDCGYIFFTISKKSLKDKNFDDCRFCHQCS